MKKKHNAVQNVENYILTDKNNNLKKNTMQNYTTIEEALKVIEALNSVNQELEIKVRFVIKDHLEIMKVVKMMDGDYLKPNDITPYYYGWAKFNNIDATFSQK